MAAKRRAEQRGGEREGKRRATIFPWLSRDRPLLGLRVDRDDLRFRASGPPLRYYVLPLSLFPGERERQVFGRKG